jgi:hypothetical protein
MQKALTRAPHSRTCLPLGVSFVHYTLALLIAYPFSSHGNIPHMRYAPKAPHRGAFLFPVLGTRTGNRTQHLAQSATVLGFAYLAKASGSLLTSAKRRYIRQKRNSRIYSPRSARGIAVARIYSKRFVHQVGYAKSLNPRTAFPYFFATSCFFISFVV